MTVPRFIHVISWSFIFQVGFTQSVSKSIHTILLGEEKVWVDDYERPGSNVVLINLHDNENTAAEAGQAFIQRHGGRLIELRHGRGREVVVRLEGVLHRFDPNRMFSDKGLRASLHYFRNNSDKVFALAASFRDTITAMVAMDTGKVIIAVHNNTEGKMNIHDFKPGGWYGDDTRDVFTSPVEDPDDFFVVTDEFLFDSLSSRGYNTALFSDDAKDRGRLIEYCSARKKTYIAVDVEHGKLTQQTEMLETLWDILQARLKQVQP